MWSVDNEYAKAYEEREKAKANWGKRRGRRVRNMPKRGKGGIMLSGAMLMEVETVLQTQVCSFSVSTFLKHFH